MDIEYFMESARVRCLHTSCGVSEIERVRFLIQNNECVNTVQSTFHVVLCLLYTYWDWTPSLNYDKLYLNKCGQTTITERKQLRKKRSERAQIKSKTYEIKLAYLNSPSSRLTERINSARYLSRSSGVIADNSRSSFFSPLKKSFKSFTSSFVFPCVFLFSRLSTYSSTEES